MADDTDDLEFASAMRVLGLQKDGRSQGRGRPPSPAKARKRPVTSVRGEEHAVEQPEEDFEALLLASFGKQTSQQESPATSEETPPAQRPPDTSRVYADADFANDDATFAEAVANLSDTLHVRDEQQDVPESATHTRRTIDLHGLRRADALQRLGIFVKNAASEGVHEVLVITGRGLHSKGHAVLKEATREWLIRARAGDVIDFGRAPTALGGAGAWLVRLR